jgi:PAS domain S-box-containing protein
MARRLRDLGHAPSTRIKNLGALAARTIVSPITDIGIGQAILIVDDDPDIRESLGDLLQQEGYHVHLTGTGGEAIRQAQQAHYGAVILDIGLPDLDGHAVLKALSQAAPQLPVIILTGHGTEQNTVGPMTRGAFAYVVKPYRSAEIKAVTRRACDVRAMSAKAEYVEHALSESEERFRSIVQSTSDAIVIAEDSGKIVFWNHGAQEMFLYERDEVLGQPLTMIMPARYREAHQRGLERVTVTGEFRMLGRPVELCGLRKDGTEFPLELSLAVWKTTEHICFGGIIRDITARKRSETAQAAQYAVTRALAGAATFTEVSATILQSICEGLGWDLGEIWTVDEQSDVLHCLQLWHSPELNAQSFAAFARQTAFPRGTGLPGRVWSSGEPAWIADVTQDPSFVRAPMAVLAGLHGALAFPITLNGEVYGVVEFFSCHTCRPYEDLLQMLSAIASQIGQFMERRRAQNALHDAYDRLDAILVSLPCLILIVDEDLRVAYANPQANTHLRPEVATLTGTPLQEVVPLPVHQWARLAEDLRSAACHGTSLEERDIEIRKRVYRYRPFPITLHSNPRRQAGLAMWDVTEQKQLQDQLIQAEKLSSLGTLVSGMAHEINNPVQGILGMAQVILEEDDHEKVKQYARDIVQCSVHVGDVVRNFACYARPASRDGDIDLDLCERMMEAVRLLQRCPQYGQVVVVTEFQPTPRLRARRTEIDQVFVNLISNAVEAMSGVGQLTLRTCFRDDTVTVAIQDTGCGIPPHLLGKIFDPFVTTKDPGKGTGLGLSIVYKIVSKYGGRIAVESDEGKGSTFTVEFPLTRA